jgi:hypothetical protein
MSAPPPSVPSFDPTKIAFGPKDGKFVGTTIDGVLVKFCLGSKDAPLRAPFGISEPFQEGETTHRRTMDLDLSDPALLAHFQSLDEAVVAAAVKNSVSWFGKQLEEAAIRTMHTALVKLPQNEKYAPTLRTKVNVCDSAANATDVYLYKDAKTATKGTKNDVQRGSAVVAHAILSSVMFGNKQFGVSLTVDKLMVKPAEDKDGAAIFGVELVDEVETKPPTKKPKLPKAEEIALSDF